MKMLVSWGLRLIELLDLMGVKKKSKYDYDGDSNDPFKDF